MSFLYRWILRRRLSSALSRGERVSLHTAARLWALSDIIYLGPVGPSARRLPELHLFRMFVESADIDDQQIEQLLADQSATVAGYAFEILLARRSKLAATAVEKLRGRKDPVTMGLGCMVCYLSLIHI